MIRAFLGATPRIAASAYVDPSAQVIGNVIIGERSSVWPNVVLRGEGSDKTRLFFTKTTGLSYASHLRFLGDGAVDLELPLTSDGAPRASSVEVEEHGGTWRLIDPDTLEAEE